jgi:cysteinyl-tRNA synthetase
MSLVVYNTLTRKKESFEPIPPGKVGIYLCGPTVYRPSHIGHAVGPIIFDAIKRYLVHCGYDVTWVLNITDVDDKLIVEAAEQGTTTAELAERITKHRSTSAISSRLSNASLSGGWPTNPVAMSTST